MPKEAPPSTAATLPQIFISPTEPEAFRALGTTSLAPEYLGVDFLAHTSMGPVGVQRKRFPNDLLSSLADGRLQKELPQMETLAAKVLLLQGKGRWTTSGTLIHPGKPWTRQTLESFLLSVQLVHGVSWLWVETEEQAISAIANFFKWCHKGDHTSLLRRVGPTRNDLASQQAHVLQGFHGLGYGLAHKILGHFGGLPLALTGDLREVPGIGDTMARRVEHVLGPYAGPPAERPAKPTRKPTTRRKTAA